MRLVLVAIVPFAISLGATACGKKPKVKSPAPAAAAKSEPVPEEAATEVATGSIRDAMLHLERVHFAFDSATLMPEGGTALQKAAEQLKLHKDVHVYIDGHTDLRGTTEYNLALGEGRARTVATYLIRLGIPSTRLHVVSFGKEQPMAVGGTALAHARNRRAEFRLMRGDVRLVLDEGVLYDDRGRRLAVSQP